MSQNELGALAMRDVWELVGAAIDLPEDWSSTSAVEAWLDGLAPPLARLVAEMVNRYRMTAAAADDGPAGWETIIPIVFPLVIQVIRAWRKRREQAGPTPTPAPSPTNV